MKKKNQLEQAIVDFTECIKLEKNHFKAYYNRANCYEKLNEFDLAKQDYFKANDLVIHILYNNQVPNSPNTLSHIGILMDRQSKLNDALDYFNRQ